MQTCKEPLEYKFSDLLLLANEYALHTKKAFKMIHREEIIQKKKEDLTRAIRGMWVLWLGGKIDQVLISPRHRQIAEQLFESARSYLTEKHPQIEQHKSNTDPSVFQSIWLSLMDGFKQGKIVSDLVGTDVELYASLSLLNGVDNVGRNILHYLAQKKCESNEQSAYACDVGRGLAISASGLSNYLTQYAPLTTARDNNNKTPSQLLVEIMGLYPKSIPYRMPFLKALMFFETPSVLKFPNILANPHILSVLTEPEEILGSLDMAKTITDLGGVEIVSKWRRVIIQEEDTIYLNYQKQLVSTVRTKMIEPRSSNPRFFRDATVLSSMETSNVSAQLDSLSDRLTDLIAASFKFTDVACKLGGIDSDEVFASVLEEEVRSASMSNNK